MLIPSTNLDSLNLSTSKPISDAKLENSIDSGFGAELAHFQNLVEGQEPQVFSLGLENQAASVSPNALSTDALENLTENLKNISPDKKGSAPLAQKVDVSSLMEEEMNPLAMPMQTAFAAPAQQIQKEVPVELSEDNKVEIEATDLQSELMASQAGLVSPKLLNKAVSAEAAPIVASQAQAGVTVAGLPLQAPKATGVRAELISNPKISQNTPEAPPMGVSAELPPEVTLAAQPQLDNKGNVVSENMANPVVLQPTLPGLKDVAENNKNSAAPKTKSSLSLESKMSAPGAFSLDGLELVKPQAMNGLNKLAGFTPSSVMGEEALPKEEMLPSSGPADQMLSALDRALGETANVKPVAANILEFPMKLQAQQLPEGVVVEQYTPVENAVSPLAAEAQSMAMATPRLGREQGSGNFSEDKEKLQDVSGESSLHQIGHKEKVDPQFQKLVEASTAQNIQASSDDHKKNMEQIISQARTILKDGGGEMKLKMSPEGMGNVDLMVAVKNGQVNIDIQTENAQIKKMFEDSIGDIKVALEGHNLKIDSMRVGIAEGMEKNLSQQQFNMSDKDFARGFMGQMRDERQGFRQQSLNNVMDKFRNPTKDPVGLRPMNSSMAARGNSSGRLNIVA